MRANVPVESEALALGAPGVVGALWVTIRPHQWVKNLFVLAPVLFLGPLFELARVGDAMLAFVAFCALASALYVFNDIVDRGRDRTHPVKRTRPIAAGTLGLPVAWIGALVLGAVALGLATMLAGSVAALLLAYALVNVAYSYWLKHVVIVDVFCIAAGFVIRVVSGSLAVDVPPSAWIVVATFLLALFLALAKRRHELVLLGEGSTDHRPVLDQYTTPLVDELIAVVTPATLLTYFLYTLDPSTEERFDSPYLYVSGVFVAFGIFRYLYLVHRKSLGGSPTDLLLNDGPLVLAIGAWLAALAILIYA